MCTCATLVLCTSGKSIVLLGSLSEQTEHEEAAVGLSVCLSVLVLLQLQPAGNTPGMMHIILSSRWLVCVLTVDHVSIPLMNTVESCFNLQLTRQPL